MRALAGMCALLVGNAYYPVDAQSLEAARRRLWGPSTGSPRPATTDPYKYLYGAANVYLEKCYEKYEDNNGSDAVQLVAGVISMINGCPEAHSLDLLEAIGSGGACWFQDSKGVLKSGTLTASVSPANHFHLLAGTN